MANRKFYRLIEYIKREIKLGKLKNQSQILPERTLAEKLNIGRSSVREGIKVLEIIGLIQSKRGGGNYITNDFNNMLCNPLALTFELQNGKIKDIIEMRKILEISNVDFLIKRITDDEIKQIENVYNEMLNCQNIEELSQLDKVFHTLMMSFSKNVLLTSMVSAISELLGESIVTSRDMFLKRFGRKEIDLEHKLIVEALKNRNSKEMKKYLNLHFENIEKSFVYKD